MYTNFTMYVHGMSPSDALKDFSNYQDRKCWMKWFLIHEMLGYIYTQLELEVGLRDFHIPDFISLYFWIYRRRLRIKASNIKLSYYREAIPTLEC